MKIAPYLMAVATLVVLTGCSSTSDKMKKLSLGMTPKQVQDTVGDPYTVRAAKVYEDGKVMEVWEYLPKFSLAPRSYWVFFENGKVVQWGVPGDFAGKSGVQVPVDEYTPIKKVQ